MLLFNPLLSKYLRLIFVGVVLLGCSSTKPKVTHEKTSPKIVVAIVVDQMRQDYLERFQEYFEQRKGFSRLQTGSSFINTHYNYLPTYTGPGHASIFTGCSPKHHGIVGNDWYDDSLNKYLYCVADSIAETVGSNSGAGQHAPNLLMVKGLGDYFKEKSPQAKVAGISLKDRSAILSAGKSADLALWLDPNNGYWISSSYYADSLPTWLNKYNQDQESGNWTQYIWSLDSSLTSSQIPDDQPFERNFRGRENCTFPYDFKKLQLINGGAALLKQMPIGNELTMDLALRYLHEEQLGKDSICDFLSISYSATDYVGHRFGTESIELVDCYIKLDAEIERLLSALDSMYGEDYLVFLSSDHGAAPPASWAKQNLNQGGAINRLELEEELNKLVASIGLPGAVKALINQQVYLDNQLDSIDKKRVKEALSNYLKEKEFVSEILYAEQLQKGVSATYNGKHYSAAREGFHPDRSGDIWYFLKPYWVEYLSEGSDHGSFETYDTHVPFLLYSPSITEPDTITQTINITDIAPTVLFQALGQDMPTSSGRNVLE